MRMKSEFIPNTLRQVSTTYEESCLKLALITLLLKSRRSRTRRGEKRRHQENEEKD